MLLVLIKGFGHLHVLLVLVGLSVARHHGLAGQIQLADIAVVLARSDLLLQVVEHLSRLTV